MKTEGLTAAEAVQAMADGWWVRPAHWDSGTLRKNAKGYAERFASGDCGAGSFQQLNLDHYYSIVGPPERMPKPIVQHQTAMQQPGYTVTGTVIPPKESECKPPNWLKADRIQEWIKEALDEGYERGWFDHKAAIERKGNA